jgi:hypothetical protein
MQQSHTEPRFQISEPLTETGNRHLQFHRRPAKVSRAGNGEEGGKIAKVQIIHCSQN